MNAQTEKYASFQQELSIIRTIYSMLFEQMLDLTYLDSMNVCSTYHLKYLGFNKMSLYNYNLQEIIFCFLAVHYKYNFKNR